VAIRLARVVVVVVVVVVLVDGKGSKGGTKGDVYGIDIVFCPFLFLLLLGYSGR
jgi:hypothetical protein